MGIDDEYRRLMEADAAMRRALDPYGGVNSYLKSSIDPLRLTGVDTSQIDLHRMAEEARRAREMAIISGVVNVDATGMLSLSRDLQERAKLAQGIVSDYERLGLLGAVSPAHDDFNEMIRASKQFEAQFRVPHHAEVGRLAYEAATASKLAASFGGFHTPESAIATAMQSMRSPWLLRDDAARSSRAFAEMQQIGRALGSVAPYDDDFAKSLRSSLGDWREVTTLPPPIFENVVERVDFYVGLGFDSTLTDFTVEAFEESAELAGLSSQSEESEDDNEEVGLARTIRAHGQLIRFERSVRNFIETAMKAEFGDDWLRRQLPAGMLEAWEEKKKIALEKGEQEQPLIAYADFTDYIRIIERKDNWARVFKAFFRRQSDVQEFFIRLFPVRVCTSHSRLITLEDELLLQVETRRVSRAFQS